MSNKLTRNELHADIVQDLDNVKIVTDSLTTHRADDTAHVYYADDTGTANAKAVMLNPAPITYKKGIGISFTNLTQNTGVVTINVNGLGSKPIIKSNGAALTSGGLKAGSIYTVRYNGTSFILQGEGGEYGTASAADVKKGITFGMENGVATGTFTGGIESTQFGNSSISNNGTATSLTFAGVDLTRSIINIIPTSYGGTGSGADYLLLRGVFTSATSASVTRYGSGATTTGFRWEVVTFYGVKSLQTIQATLSVGGIYQTSASISINKVNRAKTQLFHSVINAGGDGTTTYAKVKTYAYTNSDTLITIGTVEAHVAPKLFTVFVVEFE